ncbi:hypothetical protein AQUCO_01400280v1 [Aquilegia coerulea]|uniref:Uncharacterized protein n=1 Tax=Aquilegia coerulea TaxID=218851 RepID=A0A2G5DVR5_AQUCA|nr:hypothetical protein AQUCO_01400280v1 [Aquilegia coerulea]
MAKGFENFESIFGKVNAEWENPSSESSPLLPFLYHVHGLDSKHLRIHVTDFKSYTWESTKSLTQLEDLKDDIGLGGSWDEFVDYLLGSIKSDNVKIVLNGSPASAFGAKYAKLVAYKTKGMPIITINLDRLVDSCVTDATAYLSWQVFNAFKSRQELVVKEQHRSYELTKRLWAEQEKKESGQDQFDLDFSSKKQKPSNLGASDKVSTITTHLSDLDPISGPEIINCQDKSIPGSLAKMVKPQLVPAYRRQLKVRGVFLDDSEDDTGN